MSQGNRSSRVAGVEKLMRPRSVAIVGMSSKPGTAGHFILGNLTLNNFGGDIHLVGRSGGTIEGRPVLPSVDDLPEDVDLAIFTLPAAGVHEAMAACARRKVGAAVIFASGFAEVGKREVAKRVGRYRAQGRRRPPRPELPRLCQFGRWVSGSTSSARHRRRRSRSAATPRSRSSRKAAG